MDFTLIDKAGITQAEFAEMIGITRTTVNMWVKGKMRPNRYIRGFVGAVLASMEAAVQAGELPLTGKVPKHERAKKLSEVLNRNTETA